MRGAVQSRGCEWTKMWVIENCKVALKSYGYSCELYALVSSTATHSSVEEDEEHLVAQLLHLTTRA